MIQREKLNEAEFNAIMRGETLPPRKDEAQPAPAQQPAPDEPKAAEAEPAQQPLPENEPPAGPVDIPGESAPGQDDPKPDGQ